MSAAIESGACRGSISATVEAFLQQFPFEKFEPLPRLAHCQEVVRHFLGTIAGDYQRKFSVLQLESAQGSKCGFSELVERIFRHGRFSRWERGHHAARGGLHWRDTLRMDGPVA